MNASRGRGAWAETRTIKEDQALSVLHGTPLSTRLGSTVKARNSTPRPRKQGSAGRRGSARLEWGMRTRLREADLAGVP